MENEIDFGNEKEPEQPARLPSNIVNETGEEFGLDDLGGKWVKNPEVGNATEKLTIKKIMKNFKIDAKDKKGKAFKTNLSGVDYKYDVYCENGVYSPSSWEVFGKLKEICRRANELKMFEGKSVGAGIVFSVEHTRDGMANKDDLENYKVIWHKSDGDVEITKNV